ncbi:hypothetical protein FKM82_021227 [Ascaphus truei]
MSHKKPHRSEYEITCGNANRVPITLRTSLFPSLCLFFFSYFYFSFVIKTKKKELFTVLAHRFCFPRFGAYTHKREIYIYIYIYCICKNFAFSIWCIIILYFLYFFFFLLSDSLE